MSTYTKLVALALVAALTFVAAATAMVKLYAHILNVDVIAFMLWYAKAAVIIMMFTVVSLWINRKHPKLGSRLTYVGNTVAWLIAYSLTFGMPGCLLMLATFSINQGFIYVIKKLLA